MTPQRWQQIKEILQAALKQDPSQRVTFLDEICANDIDLRQEIESLLSAHEQTGSFISSPAMEVAAGWMAEDRIQSKIGQNIGSYRIVRHLGTGGMGDVYVAEDGRLGRHVAVKLLPNHLVGEEERVRRFEQEARAVGVLNHPNILIVHDVGTHDDAPYIVSELLEGETLRERLADGALPQRVAMEYALQIALGLSAAHEKGVVHRDLKPENLFVTFDGRVKILDFGLAKLKTQKLTSAVPNVTPRSVPGVVMGTVGYMSPEQVRGEETDHRSDIFAFGVILYEMLSGQRPFRGETPVETMNAILKEEPPALAGSQCAILQALERLIRHCLEKKSKDRFQAISDVAFNLEGLNEVSGPTPLISTQLPGRFENWNRLGWRVTAGALLLATAALAMVYFQRVRVEVRAVRSFIPPPDDWSFYPIGDAGGMNAGPVAVSPDGRQLAFVAESAEGRRLLWVRSLNALSAKALTGTDGARFPFWSPDSRHLGFFVDRELKRIEVSGGPPTTVCEAPAGRGGTWSRVGVIVFAREPGALYRVPAAGGGVTTDTWLNELSGEATHRWPYFLPDGKHFFYLARSTAASETQPGTVYVASLESNESKPLLQAGSNVSYSQGYLLFLRETTLMAQPFDDGRLSLKGDAFPIAEQILYASLGGRGVFSVSENGVLAYHTRSPQTLYDLWILPLSGARKPGSRPPHFSEPIPFLQTEFAELNGQLSPDGRWIAFQSNESGRGEVYVAPFPGPGGKRQVSTSGTGGPRWRGDGREIFYKTVDHKMMAVPLRFNGGTMDMGLAQPLFEFKMGSGGPAFDVTAYGQRYLVKTLLEPRGTSPITLVMNWTADLKK